MKQEIVQNKLETRWISSQETIDNKIVGKEETQEIMTEEDHLAIEEDRPVIEEDRLATEGDHQATEGDHLVTEEDHQVIEKDLPAKEMTEEEIIEGKKVLEIADEVVHMATEGEVGEEVIKTRFKRVIRLEDMKKKDQKVIQNLILSQNALQI